jgi:tRNA (guanine37-N1)-methyltransferase
MKVDILSLFPEYFSGPFDVSILKRARESKLLDIRLVDIRDFASKKGNYAKVDDRPYGGGPGMVLMPEPVCEAIRSVKTEKSHVVYLSPQGKKLTAAKCQELSQKEHLVLLCGHYEGVDERALKEVDEEISIGDYVLTNGCLAAIVLIDATARFIPGVLGHEEAAGQDSFQGGIFDAPHYTRPEVFEGMAIPDVLKSGNHAEIAKWRLKQGKDKTKRVRPDLIFLKENQNETE